MTRTLDDSTKASDPGRISLSHDKLQKFLPELYGVRGLIGRIRARFGGFPVLVYLEEQLQHGDSRAAVVVATDPLLVAAYTDELDCVALLRFSEDLVDEYSLKVGTRLLTVNTYKNNMVFDPDLDHGPKAVER
jgi:hypothetical protein